MCLDLQQIKDYILYLVLPGSALPKVMEDIRLLSLIIIAVANRE